MRQRLVDAVPDLQATLETITALAPKIPAFSRPTEYMALSAEDEYGMYEGVTVETVLADGSRARYAVDEYRSCTNEYVVPQSTAKFTRNRLDSYAVGALARFNVNYDKLHPEAKKVAEALGMQPTVTNPYMNSVAQVIEIVHSAYEGIRLMDELLAEGLADEPLVQPARFGTGASAVEVPRGILFHEYTYDDDGMCLAANCIIPTNQNHANIQGDFNALLPELLRSEMTEQQMELAFEMLVRAYDPCISCSTHYLDVEFVR